ncbi:hypothetical protein [Streptomyces spectabilis]|uniref:Uncharacterized protein n=1 Tax=Streptomyces spectabilis TaxID=68270 RepID=A0A5P2X4P2_STRST|nr:hypothetical protein [Streptomyces spectabilis]MBB5107983.1 hypothetical protein [Streptomyces spectabilis]MCI3907915.1 hypothetical protein [Streptomyces spectabilis]QEV57372.1 hypothetical protein CP982_00295 [Streptomyces spectabilis]GGV53338.1 hypothetical protein GCM10010245_84210 [Streptomyces spectabilis]
MTTTHRHESAPNTATALNFSGPHVQATLVTNARHYAVDGTAIVVNPQPRRVTLSESPRTGIPPLSSTILRDTRIEEADTLILLRTDPDAPIGAITDEPGWQLLADLLPPDTPTPAGTAPFPRDTPLHKSPQDHAGTVRFDPAHLLKETEHPTRPQEFQVKANLWYAPAGTHCHIHNSHDFIEVHTQVHGLGRMQKFTAQDRTRLYEDLRMAPGYTTPDPFCATRPDGSYHYPWHQYYADTDCVWLAVEYHRLTP